MIEYTGRTLKFYRALRGLRQADLAKVVGKDRSHISRIETGRIVPGPLEAQKIADALQPKK